MIPRGALGDAWRAGPLIIEEYDATCVVPHDARARLDALGNIEIELPEEADMSDARLDPITFEVIKNALSSAADEMALIVMRSAYSPVVRDTMDYSTALCDRRGQLIAQGLTLAVQLGSFPDGMRILMADHAPTAQPGDVFLYNDPYGSGGQHLPDFYIVKPIFHDGAIEGWACTMAHHCDVGGIAPGSTAIHATEIFQEGICLPVVKLHEAGEPNEMLLRILEKNTRMPVQLIGDVRAQLAACAVGERGYRRPAREVRSARTCAAISTRCRIRPSG